MPNYNYQCLDCLDNSIHKNNDVLINGQLPDDIYESEVLYEVKHSVKTTKEELDVLCRCPRCGSINYEKSLYNVNITSYTRGYGYLDKNGCVRDMNKYKLLNDDPYAKYRQPGEVDHLKDKLDKQGKHDPKTVYFS